jgi:DNA-binding CsgD family transcriptional regulator
MQPTTAPVVAPADLEHIKRIEAGSTPAPSGGLTSTLLFGLIAALMSTDLAIEFHRGVPIALQTFELLIFVSALAGMAFHWWKRIDEQRRADQELAIVRAEAHKWSEDARRWNREAQQALAGLGAAIDRQFDRWALTPAEREVALLQLKGLRHQAIADLRQTSERTVRKQALAIYRKSGLSGRSDLAAFFLEDLLLPKERTSSDAAACDE